MYALSVNGKFIDTIRSSVTTIYLWRWNQKLPIGELFIQQE